MSEFTEISIADYAALWHKIQNKAKLLGFQEVGVSQTDLKEHIARYQAWLDADYHGDLDYMQAHGSKRWTPSELIEGTLRVISLRMDYLPEDTANAEAQLADKTKAYISRYTLGRDYHKLIRKRLKHLIDFIQQEVETHFQFRAFVDSAPVLERAFAQQAGLGWFGKNTMLINRSAGSWFFIGEIYTDLKIPVTPEYEEEHCGRCTACLDICPTQAFDGPYKLDARKCISYLTIEQKGSIPIHLRKGIGNRIFGCDDCQLVCPWNRFAQVSTESDFSPRHAFDTASLVELFLWSEETFLSKTEGSAIRRTGYEGWLRNIAIALGNSPTSDLVIEALKERQHYPSALIQEHVAWAIQQHEVPLTLS